MNILYDNQIFATQIYGGVSRIFYELIKNLLAKENLNILLFHGFYINRFPLEDLKDSMFYYSGKKISRLPHTAKIIRVFNTLFFHYCNPSKNTHLFHPTDFSPIVSRWKTTPVVLTIYDMIPELFPHYFKDIKSRLKIKKESIHRADKIICISHSTKNDLINFYNLNKDKIEVIYPGRPSPDKPFYVKKPLKSSDSDPKEKLSHNIVKRPFILYVGIRKGYKNFKALIDAFSSNHRINNEFYLLCFGGGSFTGEEAQTISKLGCKGKVFQLTGDDRLLANLFKNASLFVYPSLYEGFGLPPLEAMANNCPVVASNVASIPEVLGDAASYFNPHEPASISSSIETVLSKYDYSKKLIEKGSLQVKKYSWSKMAEETFQVYKKVIAIQSPEI